MTYKPTKNRDLPIPWMAIEVLRNETFSLKGDVWAYGIVIWELMTLARMRPYHQMSLDAIGDYLKKGHRLAMPIYCPRQLYDDVMMPCWEHDMNERPTFTILAFIVRKIILKLQSKEEVELDSAYEIVISSKKQAQD